LRKYAGEVWRHVPKGSFALHVGYLLKASGRWNRRGEYACIYTAFSRDGAIAEYAKMLKSAALSPADAEKRDLVTIKINLSPILDLGTEKTRRRLSVTKTQLIGDNPRDFELCRSIADFARSEGYTAIRSPSAAKKKEYNLNIYFDGKASNIDITDGTLREPLNYGSGLTKYFV